MRVRHASLSALIGDGDAFEEADMKLVGTAPASP
jgi:hypothetical protein